VKCVWNLIPKGDEMPSRARNERGEGIDESDGSTRAVTLAELLGDEDGPHPGIQFVSYGCGKVALLGEPDFKKKNEEDETWPTTR